MENNTIQNKERETLQKAIWNIAENLRGSVEGWDFKSYVLGTMFYRYISESFAAYVDKDEDASGNADFRYADMSDADAVTARNDLVDTRGFFMLPSQLFCNVHARAARDKSDLNEVLEKAFRDIEASSKGRLSKKCFFGLFW